MFARGGEVVAGDVDEAELGVGEGVVGLFGDHGFEQLEGAAEVAFALGDQRQLVAGLGVLRVELQGVAELDLGFFEVALSGERLAAVDVALFLLRNVAARGEQQQRDGGEDGKR